MVEDVIVHKTDYPSLGLVIYTPYECAANLGLDEAMVNTTKIYPNPNSGTFNVVVKEPSTFIISDVTGRQLKSGVLQKGINPISTITQPGNYFITIKNNEIITKKLIVK